MARTQQRRSAQQQPGMGWLLRLPPRLEQQFWQEDSVQRVYTLLDVLAVAQLQALVLNWSLMRKFGSLRQAASFVASVHSMLASTCGIVRSQWPWSSDSILPACQQLNWLAHAAGQLLDWQVPVDPLQLSTASDAVCVDPLAALVLLKVWVRLVLIVLVPCALVYCLERSLKAGFLSTRHVSADAAPLASTRQHTRVGPQHLLQVQQPSPPLGSVHASGPGGSARFTSAAVPGMRVEQLQVHPMTLQQRRRQQHEALEQALLAVQPADVQQLLLPGGGLGLVRCAVSTGLALCAVLVSWLLCEVLVLALLRGRALTCAADGWLRLQ